MVPRQQGDGKKGTSDEITVERSGVPLRMKNKQNKGNTQSLLCAASKRLASENQCVCVCVCMRECVSVCVSVCVIFWTLTWGFLTSVGPAEVC